MDKKFKCPMMCPMKPMYMAPQMPMMHDMEMMLHHEDEEDDRHFMRMYPESCKKMMLYVKIEIDRMEKADHMMHDKRPDREMIDRMTENAYKEMIRDMPEMAEEESRQPQGRRFTRDILRLLLLNELFRRRRRRRRRPHYNRQYLGYDDNFDDFGFDDFEYDYYDYEDFDFDDFD